MDEEKQAGIRKGANVRDALARFLPVLTAGMSPGEAKRARTTYEDLFLLSASTLGGEAFAKDVGERVRRTGGLPLGARRRMLEEDALAAEVEGLDRFIRETAVGVLAGEISATAEVKREIRRASARLGRANAVLVGRFPHLTPLLAKVSESYLDAMFILGGGTGPASTRLQLIRKEEKQG
jgi:hypothetical protein